MSPEESPRLSIGGGVLLIFIALLVDGAKVAADAFFGIGLVINPFVITPIAAIIFAIVLDHYGISMFSGKAAWAGWSNLVFSMVPVLDFLPDWTAYAVFLMIASRTGAL